MKGFVRELFVSIQGEGIKVGERQAFIRLLGCNLSCRYCDTPETRSICGLFYYRNKELDNPISVDYLIKKISEPVIAFTGGEPLLQIDFVEALCKKLKKLGKSIYLDTNGTQPEALERAIKYLDTIALDFKIPSATGLPGMWRLHEQCLRIASGKEVFVKIVIDNNLLNAELRTVCNVIGKISKKIPLVIQPVFGSHIPRLLDIQKKALKNLNDVRIIPQIHKYLHLK